MIRRHIFLGALPVLLLVVGIQQLARFGTTAHNLTSEEFQQVSLQLSEPSGFFGTDNLVSNETSYLHVSPRIEELAAAGQAYIGVGPDQNFTYIAQSRPAVAFIIDIRRDNLLQHLYFKSLFRQSADRWDYLSGLFGRVVPKTFKRSASANAADLVRLFKALPADKAFFEAHLQKLWNSLRRRFPALVTETDRVKVHAIASAFFIDGLDVRYEIPGRRMFTFFPSYAQLMVETDLEGELGHYLNSEEDFQFLKRMQRGNRIIPVVGNFGGYKALRSIGAELRKRGFKVSVFYLSNVEFYLFRSHTFRKFIDNVRQLPLDEDSLLIRSYFNNWFGTWRTHPFAVPNYFSTSLTQRIQRFLELDRTVPYYNYWDLVTRDYLGAPARPSPAL
ncbi:MAG: hypothetical protein ACE5JX_07510 [Acidobacteriota bacterium]